MLSQVFSALTLCSVGDTNGIWPVYAHVMSSDVSSRTWPRPRGASRTKSSGLGLDNEVLGLGLGLEIKSSAIM